MKTDNAWIAGALKTCMQTDGFCPTECPGYAHCVGDEGADVMMEAGKLLEEKERTVRMLIDGMSGAGRVYLYFAAHGPVDTAELPEDGYIAHVEHAERKYIRMIDSMVYGTYVYSRRLEPQEIEKARLTSAPRE